jgi:hypothetical protein
MNMRPVERSASRRVSTSHMIGPQELAEPSKPVT